MSGLREDLLNPDIKKKLETFKLDKTYTRGENTHLYDAAGVAYLDFIAQYGAVPFGYNPAFIWDALEQVRKMSLPSLVQPSLPGAAIKLANMLADCSPGELCYSTFCQSGTEAVEAAIKLARSKTGKEIIISTDNSFHGKTLGALSATGKDSYQAPFRAPAPGFLRIPYNDIDALSRILKERTDDIAGFIVEPVQGEGGIVVAQQEYLKKAQALCNEFAAVFIVDEIQTGLGRTGRLFACDHEGIEPDVMLLAKALGGGLVPLGVCLSSPRVWNEDFGLLHSSTFANNNLTCAVGIAVLEKLCRDNGSFLLEIKEKGEYLLEKAQKLAERYPDVIREVRGQGLMVGIEFYEVNDVGSYDIAYLANQGGFTALLAGFLLNVYHIRLAPFLNNSMTLRLEPPLTIDYNEINYLMESLEILCQILSYRDFACLYRYLIGDNKKPDVITDYRSNCRTIKSSVLQEGETAKNKFAFIIHYPAPEDVVINNMSFITYDRDELFQFMDWQSKITDPGLVCYMPAVKSKNGAIAEGWLIGVPFGAREMMNLPREKTVNIIARAVDMGKDLGAGIVGLGALTSVVTRGGRAVTKRDVAITSGNSYTTLMAVEALLLGAQKMHIDPFSARVGVVGASGSIGRACALMLSEKTSLMTLFGNPDHPGSSKNRLNSLTQDILVYARRRLQKDELEGMSLWLSKAIDNRKGTKGTGQYLDRIMFEEKLSPQLFSEACLQLDIECPIKQSLNINKDLPECPLVIATSNSPDFLIFPEDIQPGAVVCDVAKPADVAPQVYQQRNDVLVLEGGLVQYPDNICFGPNLGYRDGVNLACLSETLLLALEGDYQDYSIGNKLSLDTIHYFRHLAQKHGFSLAGLRMGNHEINDRDVEAIYNRIQRY